MKFPIGLGKDELEKKCKDFKFQHLSREVLDSVLKSTYQQSKSRFWFQMRAGRITASNFKAAMTNADKDKPAMGLLNKICYPLMNKFAGERLLS